MKLNLQLHFKKISNLKSVCHIVSLTGIFLCIISCTKTSEVVIKDKLLIDYTNDTNYIVSKELVKQEKNVLLQEFTGVYCYTCPLAHEITHDIIETFGDRVIPMNIHSHFFKIYDDPRVMGNLYDFRTEDGDSIVNMLGNIESIPSAAFEMRIQPNETRILSHNRSNWKGYFNDEINMECLINVELTSEFDMSKNQIKIVTKFEFLKEINSSTYYSVAITENNIIDKQFVDTAIVNDYSHNYILRDLLNVNPKGDLLGQKFSKGQTIIKVHYTNIDKLWKLNELNFIAYVHNSGSNYDVYQASTTKL